MGAIQSGGKKREEFLVRELLVCEGDITCVEEEMKKQGESSEERLLERLEAHPELKARVVRLLELVENEECKVTRASEAEERVIKEIKELGREVMEGWARRLVEEASNREERSGAER
jgi:hypothetical protein